MTTFRYVGYYAAEISADGKTVPVAPGDFVDISIEDMELPENAVMFEEGSLLDTSAPEGEELGGPSPPIHVPADVLFNPIPMPPVGTAAEAEAAPEETPPVEGG